MEAGAKPLTIAPRGLRLAERLRLSYVDGILLGTSIGLAALSVFVLATATSEEIAGQPGYFAIRQGLYAVVGVALMVALAQLDYTRLSDLRLSIYVTLVAAIALVLLGGRRPRLAALDRASPCSASSHPSSPRCSSVCRSPRSPSIG